MTAGGVVLIRAPRRARQRFALKRVVALRAAAATDAAAARAGVSPRAAERARTPASVSAHGGKAARWISIASR